MILRCTENHSSDTPMCPEIPWKNIFEQPFCYTSEKDLNDWRALVREWPPESQDEL